MEILRIGDRAEAADVAREIGSAFFEMDRLDRFVTHSLADLSLPVDVRCDRLREGTLPAREVSIWSAVDGRGARIGGMTLHRYRWERLREQRYLERWMQGGVPMLRVTTIGELIAARCAEVDAIAGAVELAYYVVEERHRGHGVGRAMFDEFVRDGMARAKGDPTVLLTIVLGRYARFAHGHVLMDALDGHPDGRPVSELIAEIGGPDDLFGSDPGAEATVHLASSSGFEPLGYSKSLGQVWAKVVYPAGR